MAANETLADSIIYYIDGGGGFFIVVEYYAADLEAAKPLGDAILKNLTFSDVTKVDLPATSTIDWTGTWGVEITLDYPDADWIIQEVSTGNYPNDLFTLSSSYLASARLNQGALTEEDFLFLFIYYGNVAETNLSNVRELFELDTSYAGITLLTEPEELTIKDYSAIKIILENASLGEAVLVGYYIQVEDRFFIVSYTAKNLQAAIPVGDAIINSLEIKIIDDGESG